VAELERTDRGRRAETIAGFVARPISFSCGFFPPPAGYFGRACARCSTATGILFLDDEVICGYGRTGELFAAGSMGLRPDMMSLAKGMTSGYFPSRLRSSAASFTTGSSRAAPGTAPSLTPRPARAIPSAPRWRWKMLRIVEEDRLLEQVRARIPALHRHLHALAEHPVVGHVRAYGLAGALTLTSAKLKGGVAPQPMVVWPGWAPSAGFFGQVMIRSRGDRARDRRQRRHRAAADHPGAGDRRSVSAGCAPPLDDTEAQLRAPVTRLPALVIAGACRRRYGTSGCRRRAGRARRSGVMLTDGFGDLLLQWQANQKRGSSAENVSRRAAAIWCAQRSRRFEI